MIPQAICVFFLLILSSYSISWAENSPRTGTCPLPEAGEKDEDCPWAEAARRLSNLQEVTTLKQVLPNLYRQVSQDGTMKELKSLWGESINFDEFANREIVSTRVLEELGRVFRLPQDMKKPRTTAKGYRIVHAGMEHTYGYLLSTLKTTFGFKRARWVSGEIERGFGLPRAILGPLSPRGTLFLNVSQFIGRIILQNNPTALKKLDRNTKGLPKEILNFSYGRLKITRLLEETPSGVVLQTNFVRFVHPQNNTSLLIYSVMDPSASKDFEIITAFPVTESFVQEALKTENLGDNKRITTRYNAYVASITDVTEPILGRRTRVDYEPLSK